MEDYIKRFLAALESIAKSLLGIDASLKNAQLKDTKAPAAPATATAAAPPAPAPPPPPAPVEDDLGLDDPAPAAAVPEKLTKEKVLTLARDASEKKGRPFVKKCLEAVGAASVKELKEDKFTAFVAELAKDA